MRRKQILPLLVASFVLVGTVGLAACGDDGGGGGEASFNLTIGDLVPLTGDLSDFGPPGRKAADLAVKQINDAIREVGVDQTVRVVHEDDQTDAQAGVQAARKLVGAENTPCIAGSWASSVSIPVAESVATRERIVQISPASTSFEITGLEDDGYMNRTAPPDSLQGPALADAMEEQLGGAQGKTVNIGARNDQYGEGLGDFFADAWREKGGEIGERVLYDPEQPSYNSEARQIARGNPDAYVIIDFPETYQKVGPALVRTGEWDPSKTFITDGLVSGALPEDVGSEATEGLRGTAPGTPQEGGAAQAFGDLFERSAPRNIERQTFDGQNFDAVMLCYLAAVAAGEADGEKMKDELQNVSGPGGDKYTFEQLPDAIRALQDGNDIDYEGASGPIDLDDAGDPTAGVYDVIRFRNGEIDPIRQVPIEKEGT